MDPGQRVRIKTAPERIGVLTSDCRVTGGKNRWMVQFSDGKQRLPESNLEVIEENESIESLLNSSSYGSSENLRRAITHARLTGKLADVIYSMEATNTEFYAYQFKPVLNFLESPSNGILIADEVGLGKTIEAGLIWTELRVREDAKRLLILCPAVLRYKWASELGHRFGIKAEVCDAVDVLSRLQDRSIVSDSFALVASIQGVRPSKGWEDDDNIKTNSAKLARYIDAESATRELFDCVIVDEAHYMRNPDSQTHKLGQLIRQATKNIVMLSATPIQLKSNDLYHLLNIIDAENFQYKRAFEGILRANQPIMGMAGMLRTGSCSVEALKQATSACLAHPLLRNNRQLLELLESPPDQAALNDIDYRVRLANRVERINLLGSVINRTRKRDVKEQRVIRVPLAPQIVMNDVERSFYQNVTDRVRQYCERFELFEGFLLTIPQRQMCSSMPAAFRAWQKRVEVYDEEIIAESVGSDESMEIILSKNKEYSNSGPLISELASLTKECWDYEVLRENDTKYEILFDTLSGYWEKNRGYKVVLFSFYRETLKYLQERLREDGVSSRLLMGGMGGEKEKIISEFRDHDDIKILLTSEVLSEGVDLQFSSALINYDLPWNPMRVEQRVGRIDRIGQKEGRILIWNMFYDDTLDDRIYNRLYLRLDIFRQALGDLEAVLGERIRTLTYDLLAHDLTAEQEKERIEQTAAAIANERQNQETLENEAAGLAAHGDYVLNKVSAAKEMRRFIDGEHLWIYIRDFLKSNYKGSTLVEEDFLSVDIDLSLQAKNDLRDFIGHGRESTSTALVQSIKGRPVRCKFYNNVDMASGKYEVINQNHPLVRFAAHNTESDSFHPVVAVKIHSSELDNTKPGKYMFLAKRWSTTGTKTTEKLVYRAINIDSGTVMDEVFSEKLVMALVASGDDWGNVKSEIDDIDPVEVYHNLENLMDDLFVEYCRQMTLENEDRVDLSIATINGQIDRQIQSKRESIYTLEVKGNSKMVKLFEGQIKSLEMTRERKVIELNQKRKISNIPSDVTLGVVRVE